MPKLAADGKTTKVTQILDGDAARSSMPCGSTCNGSNSDGAREDVHAAHGCCLPTL